MTQKKQKTGMTVGIDVSKAELVVAYQPLSGDLVELTVCNDGAGHEQLIKLFKSRNAKTRVAIEPTGNFHLDLALAFVDAGIEVMLVNPLAARRYAEAQRRRAKTDRVDARVLLDFVQRMEFQPWHPPTRLERNVRALVRYMGTLIVERTALMNQRSACKATDTTTAFILEDLKATIKATEARIDACQKEALRLLATHEDLKQRHECLTTIRGFGDRSALQLMAELIGLDPEMTPDQVVAHAGLDPRPHDSGPKKGRRTLSKVGNARLRTALHMPALTAIRWSDPVKAWYDKLRERKPAMVAIAAVCRRLLRVAWVIYQRKQPWDEAKFAPRAPRESTAINPEAEKCA